jgi:uncharacterized membrane protein
MTLFNIVLALHIISGSVGLLLGTYVLIRKKGDKVHKLLGKIFVIAMIMTGFSAFALSYIHPNFFLFIVGVFTIYLTFTGYRMIYLKNILKGQKPIIADYLVSFLMLVACGFFIFFGLKNIIQGNNFGIVLIFFGSISLRLCYLDYRLFTNKTNDKMYWLKNHIGRMTGAYIAALTAFIVVNNTVFPPVLAWSLPGIIGTIFISRTIKKLTPKKVLK